MKIINLLRGPEPVFSFEFFPPKNEEGKLRLLDAIAELKPYRPAYVSVTYGAGGSTRGLTCELVRQIQNEIGLETMAHLTCVGASAAEIESVLREFQSAGLDNILALRGDPPKGESDFVKPEGGFAYASELAEFVRSRFDFCVAGACYPEVHPEAASKEADLDALVQKVEAGAEFLVTQLFFDNRDYYDLVSRLRSRGVEVPVVAGIMPITNFSQVDRFAEMCGAKIPADLRLRLEQAGDNVEEVRKLGIEHATQQCLDLLQNGCPGIHFYTLNRSQATRRVLENLREKQGLAVEGATCESAPKASHP